MPYSLVACVVDTGRLRYVASSSHVPEAASAHSMPYMYNSGALSNTEIRAMPPATVLVNSAP
jgi:hypothetical protein